MNKIDENVLLKDMYDDGYFPDFLVDKVKEQILKVVSFLEIGEKDIDKIQEKLDEMTISINELEDEFDENESEIETVARDSIGVSVEYVLQCYDINIDIEDAIREREW
ncbi:DUF5713 family protein [Cellulosilyticum sp. I15G10I2]|uniref:DUF5713 family protein n=1 Tax=Cellulosilyticum sp. I15G10I2 TaxID=1892843 RepID=UPI00085C451A|nr:DUF5713 family protein [Cellulosilyticum sp. I15G10I2]